MQEESNQSQHWKLRLLCPTYVCLFNYISAAASIIASVLSVCQNYVGCVKDASRTTGSINNGGYRLDGSNPVDIVCLILDWSRARGNLEAKSLKLPIC